MIYKIVDGVEIGYKLVDGKMVAPSEDEVISFVNDSKEHQKDLLEYDLVKYREQRANEYAKRGAGILSVVEAIRESIMENKPEKLQAIQAIVDRVKLEFPKPEVTRG